MFEFGAEKLNGLYGGLSQPKGNNQTCHLKKQVESIEEDCANIAENTLKFFKLQRQMGKDHLQWITS